MNNTIYSYNGREVFAPWRPTIFWVEDEYVAGWIWIVGPKDQRLGDWKHFRRKSKAIGETTEHALRERLRRDPVVARTGAYHRSDVPGGAATGDDQT